MAQPQDDLPCESAVIRQLYLHAESGARCRVRKGLARGLILFNWGWPGLPAGVAYFFPKYTLPPPSEFDQCVRVRSHKGDRG